MNQNETAKRCAVYGRVSSEDPDRAIGDTLEQQKHLGLEESKRLTLITGISHRVTHYLIEEKPVSGGNIDRPMYQRLVRLIRQKRIDVVICKELSRLNRSIKDFMVLVELCKHNNVQIKLRNFDLDPSTPIGQAVFQMLALLAELERSLGIERTRSSIRSRMRNNKKINGGNVVLGFDKHPTNAGEWVPNPTELKSVSFIMETFLTTLSYLQTSKVVSDSGIRTKKSKYLNPESIKRILTNVKYIGKLKVPKNDQSYDEVDLPFGPQVSENLFYRVQEAVKKVDESFAKFNRRGRHCYILTGLLRHEDGSPFTGHSGKGRAGESYFYYKNYSHNVSLEAEMVEEQIFRALKAYQDDEKLTKAVSKQHETVVSKTELVENNIGQLKRDLKDLDSQEKNLTTTLSSQTLEPGRVSRWLDEQLSIIESQRNQAHEMLKQLECEAEELNSSRISKRDLQKNLKPILTMIQKSPRETQRGIFRSIVKEIVYTKTRELHVKWIMPDEPPEGGKRFAYDVEWLPK